jgi:ketosteroid isomerase-like protein
MNASEQVLTAKSAERQVDEVTARYVRAADHRDSAAMAALFAEDAVVEIRYTGGGGSDVIGTIRGGNAIGHAVAGLMAPHPPRGWSHHTTFNHVVEVDGDAATSDSQFIVYTVLGAAKPAAGWPSGAFGAQGSVTPVESGYYRARLVHDHGRWLITELVISHDLPYALPEG